MLKFLMLIAVVVLDDVCTMWVRVMFLKCRLDMWLWRLSCLRDGGRCNGVGRVVIFRYCLLKKFGDLVKCFHLFDNGEAEVGFWSACVISRAAMVAFSVDYLYCIFP